MKNATSQPHFRRLFLVTATLAAFLAVGPPPSPTFAQTSDGSSDEEYSDGSMEEDYGYSTGGKSKSTGLAGTFQEGIVSPLQNIDLASLLMPSSLITVDDSPILKKEAEQAFLAGHQPLALDLMFGYMVAEYKKASVDLQMVKYSPVLKRPVWQMRWGVSLAIRGADEFADPQPIREGKSPAGGRMATRAPRGIGDPASSDDGEEYDDGSEEMNSRMNMNPAMNQAFTGGAGGNRINNAPTTSMLNEEAEQELDKALGLVAEIVGEEFRKRYQQGDFGPALANVAPPPPPVAPARGMAMGMRQPVVAPQAVVTQTVADALADSSEPPPMWRPGIVYLGQGDSKEIVKLAQSENLDFLLHFDVFLKESRTDWIQNVSRCRLIQVSTGKALGVSKSMDSAEAARLVQTGRGGERSYVEEQLENLFSIIDRQIKAIDLPRLSPEIAKKRVASLIASNGGPTSLRTLAEVRLYQTQGLIDESLVETVFNIVGGEDALTMLYGPVEDRLTMIRKWAVRAQNKVEADSATF